MLSTLHISIGRSLTRNQLQISNRHTDIQVYCVKRFTHRIIGVRMISYWDNLFNCSFLSDGDIILVLS